MGNAKVVVGVRLLKVSLTSYGHSLLQRPRASSSPVCAVSFSDLIRPFAIATVSTGMATKPRFHRFSDLIRPFAIATRRAGLPPQHYRRFSDLIRPFAIATETSAFQRREMESFSDLIRPFAIATLSGPAGSGDTQYVSVTSYGHSLLQLSVVAHYRR